VGTHFEYAKSTVGGKHTIVEKAFTTTVAEAQELAALAKRATLKPFFKTEDGTVTLKRCNK
jgi:predicted dehydrogenase